MEKKNKYLIIAGIVLLLIVAGAFIMMNLNKKDQVVEEQQANIANVAELNEEGEFEYDTVYNVNKEVSKVRWTGYKVGGSHFGTVGIKEGVVYEKDGVFNGGKFVIDMNQIVVEDLQDATENKQLTDHLKSVDFFDVTKYPEATFELTQVLQEPGTNRYSIVGNMTIKGITREVGVSAHVVRDGNKYKINSLFALDRSLFNVRYGSSSFFDNLGDKLIDNTMDFSLSLVLEKGI